METKARQAVKCLLGLSSCLFSTLLVLSLQTWHIYPVECLALSHFNAAAAAKLLQSCLTLCSPIDGSPPGSAVPGILQARTLEWVAISFSNAGKWKVKVKSLSCVRLLATPWTAAFQAPPSMGFSKQEYWSGVPLPSDQAKIWYWVKAWNINVPRFLFLCPPPYV